MICRSCGHENEGDNLFCSQCGEKIIKISVSDSNIPSGTTISNSGDYELYSVKDLYKQGMQNIKAKKYSEAQKAFSSIIQENPLDHDSWNALGISYYHLNEYDNAYKCFKKALDIDGNNNRYKKNYDVIVKKIAIIGEIPPIDDDEEFIPEKPQLPNNPFVGPTGSFLENPAIIKIKELFILLFQMINYYSSILYKKITTFINSDKTSNVYYNKFNHLSKRNQFLGIAILGILIIAMFTLIGPFSSTNFSPQISHNLNLYELGFINFNGYKLEMSIDKIKVFNEIGMGSTDRPEVVVQYTIKNVGSNRIMMGNGAGDINIKQWIEDNANREYEGQNYFFNANEFPMSLYTTNSVKKDFIYPNIDPGESIQVLGHVILSSNYDMGSLKEKSYLYASLGRYSGYTDEYTPENFNTYINWDITPIWDAITLIDLDDIRKAEAGISYAGKYSDEIFSEHEDFRRDYYARMYPD